MPKILKEKQPVVNVFEGVTRATLACGRDVLMARFDYKKGSRVPPHRHAYEQVTTILEGQQRIVIRSEDIHEEFVVDAGDSYVVPATFEHEQETLSDSVTIDTWSIAP